MLYCVIGHTANQNGLCMKQVFKLKLLYGTITNIVVSCSLHLDCVMRRYLILYGMMMMEHLILFPNNKLNPWRKLFTFIV